MSLRFQNVKDRCCALVIHVRKDKFLPLVVCPENDSAIDPAREDSELVLPRTPSVENSIGIVTDHHVIARTSNSEVTICVTGGSYQPNSSVEVPVRM